MELVLRLRADAEERILPFTRLARMNPHWLTHEAWDRLMHLRGRSGGRCWPAISRGLRSG